MRLFADIIRVTLLAVLVVTPWWFGGVWARVQWILMLLLAGLLAADLMGRFGDDDRPNLVPSAWLPVFAGVLLGLFQLVPWPASVAGFAAPTTVRWRAEWANDPPPPSHQPPRDATPMDAAATAPAASDPGTPVRRSVYSLATREYLALLTLAFAMFVLASIHLVDRQTLVWCLTATAICGAAISFFGLVQRLSWNGKFYWVFEPLEGSFESFGPFVNRNNAGGFLNLCLAAGLGLLVWVHGVRFDRWSSRQPSSRRPGERRRASASPSAEAMASDPGSPAEPTAELMRAVHRRRERREESPHERRRVDRPHSRYPSASYPLSYRSTSSRSVQLSARRIREMADAYVADLNARRLGGLTLVGFIAGGVLCTASRGSVLALFAATIVTAVALLVRRGSRRYAAALLAILVAGLGLMSWAGQTDFVRSRFELTFQPSYVDGRIPNWLDALQVVPHFPIAGSGLGTYPYVYEPFQERFLPGMVHRHAENQFIQAVVEGGLIALSLLLLVIALTVAAIVKLFRAGGPVNLPLAVTGCYALTSQVVGGMFDFGLYIPSNTMLMAALGGMVIGRAGLLAVWPPEAVSALDRPVSRHAYSTGSSDTLPPVSHRPLMDDRLTVSGVARARRHSQAALPARWTRLTAVALTAPPMVVTLLIGFLMVGCLFASLEMNRAGRIESALRHANLPRLLEENIPENFLRAAAPLVRVLPQRWDDAEAHQHLAALLLAQYQSETYHWLMAEQTLRPLEETSDGDGSAAADASDAPSAPLDNAFWSRASVQHLHGALRRLELEGNQADLQRLKGSERVQQLLLPAVRHLLAARHHAPTISRVHYRLAELSAVAPDLGDERVHLQRAQQLAPGDATLWFWSGVLHLNSGRIDQACASWHRSLELSRLHADDIMAASQGRLTIRQLIEQTLPDEADLLLAVARRHFASDERAPYREVFLARAQAALERTDLPRAEAEYTQAAILNLQGSKEEAVPIYERAISLNSKNLNWRLEFAQLLIALERFDDAYEHVNYLVTAEPKSGVYRKLQRDFNAKRWRAGVPRS